MIRNLLTEERPVAVYRHVMLEFERDAFAVLGNQILIGDIGTYTLYINHKPVVLRPGSLVLMRSGDVVRTEGAMSDFRVSCLAFSDDILRDASLKVAPMVAEYMQHNFTTDVSVICLMANRMTDIIESMVGNVSTQCLHDVTLMHLRAFFLVCYDLLGELHRGINVHNKRKEELWGKFLSLISAHYKRERTVAFYAERMNMTTRYLNDVVSYATGSNVKAVIDEYVMAHLKTTLKTDTRSIKEIAFEYGFESSSFFCDYFKKHIGLSPQVYRGGN